MFSLGGTELLIVGLVALLLFGPEKLPQLAKTVGRFMREFNKYKDILESTVRNEVTRAEWAEQDAKIAKIDAKNAAAAEAAAAGVVAAGEDGSGSAEGATPPADAPADGSEAAGPAADVQAEPGAADAPASAPVDTPAPAVPDPDEPVKSPAAVAATSEDEEDEG